MLESESVRRAPACQEGPDEPASLRLNPARRDGRHRMEKHDLEAKLNPGMREIPGFSMTAIR